jgi:hypothetical protein
VHTVLEVLDFALLDEKVMNPIVFKLEDIKTDDKS